MKLFAVLALIAGETVSVSRREIQFHQFLNTGASATVQDKSVVGKCSGAQDSIGQLTTASLSGVSTLGQCAQYAKDHASSALYVSFARSENSCMWFTRCQCLATSASCLGGTGWNSVAIADIIVPVPAVIQTSAPPSANSAIINAAAGVTTARPTLGAAASDPECDNSVSSLMQYFQSKCEMTKSMSMARAIAGIVLLFVLLLIGGAFGLAYHFDKKEMEQFNLGVQGEVKA